MKNSFVILISLTILLFGCEKTEKVDLIVHNAIIYTADINFSKKEAFAVNDGKIIAIGPEHEIRNKYATDNYFDAKKHPIYPGFIDAHCHFVGYAKNLLRVNLVGTKSFEEVLKKVVDFSKSNNQKWIIGRGWDQNDWEDTNFPTNEKLNELFPNTPVFLSRIDGHAAIVNNKALELANITLQTHVTGGKIEKKDNNLTGLLIDNAVDLIKDIIPPLTTTELTSTILKAQHNLFKVGLTTIDDAGLDKDEITLIDSLHKQGKLHLKIYAMVSAKEDLLEYYLKNGPYKTDLLNVSSFKFYADGALGSRGACLLSPYSDIHTHEEYGLLIKEKAFFEKYAQQLYNKGFQMNTHCIGDSANRLLLNIYKNVLQTTNDRRWRIEHAQVINSADFELFKKYNIIPSVQPTHATSDMYWAEKRLGKDRITNAYAYKKLLNQNGLIALGTDFPVEDISPIKTFYAAVARKDESGYPTSGFEANNALTRQEALYGMTIWAAIANFEETDKGSLEVGKSADFVVLSNDIMTTKEDQLLNINVKNTFINGKEVFSE